MPPSPALRCSPGRELRGENHKRGHSFESGLQFKEKDDDLALFNEMQTRERENFLLQSSDDLEDTFSNKLKHFSDFKLGISIPVRGESSELLNAEGEKNDYDWLLTPPDTPLFPSLDDEPPPVTAARRGRPRSQPITISRSSTMEKSYRSSRGSASPNRLSPSPRSGSGTFQSRGRPTSAPHSSPTPSLRSTTPTRRPSPPPSKPSTPAPRSSTPTTRRMSTGSSTVPSSAVRGTSPVRTSRGNSASPKIRAWQSNIPGFSLEAPPNLRTSLADRPASYVRGSSPASRNGRDSASKYSRQSMSPTASRSVSSSHSHDRDRLTSHSKGSVGSSGDDDVDSIQSVPLGGSDRSVSKRGGSFPNNRAPAFSKKISKTLSPSSAPKRSFDSALRQMDHRKSPQNMFRPLLSSVPSTTFYVGKGSSAYRSIISRNSSVTTSSNASSDQGTTAAPDTEGSDHHQDDLASEGDKIPHPNVHEEVFDKVDELSEEPGHDRHDGSSNIPLHDFDQDNGCSEEFSHHDSDKEISSTSDVSCAKGNLSVVGSLTNMEICSKCGCKYDIIGPVEGDNNLCPDCRRQRDLVTVTSHDTTTIVSEDSPALSIEKSEENKSCQVEPPVDAPESLPQVENVMQGQISFSEQSQNHMQEDSVSRPLLEGGEERLNYQQEMDQHTIAHSLPDRETEAQVLQLSNDHPDLNLDSAEGAGISVLLKRSSSGKGLVVQGRTFIATTKTYDDFSHARDSTNSLRSSIGHGSASASSSVDFSSARQTEARVQRQLSGKKSEIENYKYDMNSKTQNSTSSLSGGSTNSHHALGAATNMTEQNCEVSDGNMKWDEVETHLGSQVKVPDLEKEEASVTNMAALWENIIESGEIARSIDPSTTDLSSHTVSIELEDNSAASFPNCESCFLYENGEVKALPITPLEEHVMRSSSLDGVDVVEVHGQGSLATISEIESENCSQETLGFLIDDDSLKLMGNINELHELSVPALSDKDRTASAMEPNIPENTHGILDESNVLVECRGGSKGRSLTLEEATDTILFCSSIVHDLAYQAASMAIEKEAQREAEVPLEGSWPTVTILGKSNSDRKDSHGRTVSKRTSKSLKPRQRRVETDAKPPNKTENDENAAEPMIRNVGLPKTADSMKPPKLESKCNCTIM